jgi:hypothetical protein
MLATLTKQSIHVHVIENKKPVSHDVYEGEVIMSQQQQDYYKQLIGDGKASVTTSREISESSFGSGGKVFVSVTLICDQSMQGVASAIEHARSMAEAKAWEHHAALRDQLIQRGILKP